MKDEARSKKPKSPKKSKKKAVSVQSGRLREDPDKKAKEEEEARIQAEKEETERKEKEAVEAKERKKREKEEHKKIRAQIPELMATQARINIGLMAVEISKRDSEEWEKFLNPVGPPDPRNLPQINTYLETIEADESNENITDVLKLCKLFFEFMKTLEISRDKEEKPKAIQYIRTSMDIEEVMKRKINSATHNLLLQAKEQAPHDGDFSFCESNEWITLCIWANISKNPRVRSIEFEERNVMVEIIPFLNRLNCCIRVMFMAEDYASQRIMSSKALEDLILKMDNASSHSLASYQSISSTSASNASKRSTYDPRVLASAMGIDLDLAYKDRQKNFPKIYIREAKPSHTRIHTARSDEEVDADDAGEDEDEDEELNLDKYNLVTPPGEDIIEEPEPHKYFDLQAFHSIGGVFLIELLQLPYQPKTVKNWTIQMLVDPANVFPIPYDVENFRDRGSIDTKTMPSPLMVSFRLPDNVHIFSEPQLAYFDSEKLKWSRTNFPHKIYNEATRQISFKIMKFGLMTLMQDSHINMPFRSFDISPGSIYNSVVVTIVGRLTEVEFILEGSLICLTKPNITALSDILNEFMPLCILIKRMRQAGFNFFPGPSSSKYLSIPPKKQGTVDRLYHQLAIFGNQISFKSSVWNVGVNDEEKIVFQVNLNTTERNKGRRGMETFFEEQPEEEPLHGWSLMMVSKRQVRILKMQETSETYSDEPAAGFQSNAYSLFLNWFDKEVRERLRGTSPMFINNLHTFLMATNLLVLTVTQ